jgi:PAS domain-containing protein
LEPKLATLQRERDEAIAKATASQDYEEIKKARDTFAEEAAKYRAVVEKENDPVFVKKFTERATMLQSSAEDAVKAFVPEKTYKLADGVTDGLSLDYIRSKGGFLQWAKSHPSTYTKLMEAMKEGDPVNADILRDSIGKLAGVDKERAAELDNVKVTHKQLSEARQNEAKAVEAQRTQQMATLSTAVAKWREENYGKFDPFKIQAVPEKASAEEKTKIEANNTRANSLRNRLAALQDAILLGKGTLTDINEGALRATLYESEKERADGLDKLLKEANEILKRFNNASNPKPNGNTTGSQPHNANNPPRTPQRNGQKEPDNLAESIMNNVQQEAANIRQQRSGTLSR